MINDCRVASHYVTTAQHAFFGDKVECDFVITNRSTDVPDACVLSCVIDPRVAAQISFTRLEWRAIGAEVAIVTAVAR